MLLDTNIEHGGGRIPDRQFDTKTELGIQGLTPEQRAQAEAKELIEQSLHQARKEEGVDSQAVVAEDAQRELGKANIAEVNLQNVGPVSEEGRAKVLLNALLDSLRSANGGAHNLTEQVLGTHNKDEVL